MSKYLPLLLLIILTVLLVYPAKVLADCYSNADCPDDQTCDVYSWYPYGATCNSDGQPGGVTCFRCSSGPNPWCEQYDSYGCGTDCNSCPGGDGGPGPTPDPYWVPPACIGSIFSGCTMSFNPSLICSDWGGSGYPNWTQDLWNNCQQACYTFPVNGKTFDDWCTSVIGDISGPNSGIVGQTLSYTGNGYGSGVDLIRLYYSPTSSENWKIFEPSGECAFATTCTKSWTPAAIGTYYVVVNAYNSSLGTACSGNPWTPLPPGWQDCGSNDVITATISASSPAIDSLSIINQGNHAFSTNVMGTGRMGSESGNDWFNPINITLNTRQGSYPRKNYYAALYQRSQGAFANAATFLSDIKGYLDIYTLNTGVLLAYGQLNGDISNNTYVWTGSSWTNISNYPYPLGYPVCGIEGCLTQTYYKVYPVDATPTWKVLFYKNFLGGNLYTAVYAEDNQTPPNAAFNPDISPWLFR